MENLMVFPVPNLCKNTNTAALFQCLKRRGNKVSKAHRPRAIEDYEGDAGVNKENLTDQLLSCSQINTDSISLWVPVPRNLPL